jgi:hypothetical protein
VTVEAAGAPPFSHTVTTETVRQVPTVLEADVFRALVVLPAVTQPNDLKGRIHLAGGASDETAITLDGHPLQDPFHLFGVLGAFNVAALERADVLIHHVPAASATRLSGVIDLQTRVVGHEPSREVVASLLASSATIVQPSAALGVDLLLSGRITYIDKLISLLASESRIEAGDLPLLGYHDLVARVGRNLGNGWRGEAIGFVTRDALGVTESREREGDRPITWGERLVGLRGFRSGSTWEAAMRASLNSAEIDLRSSPQRSSFVDVRRDWLSAAAELLVRRQRAQMVGGVAIDDRDYRNSWSVERLSDDIFSPRTPSEFAGRSRATEIAAFTEAELRIGAHEGVRFGARAVSAGSGVHLAPRLLVFRSSPLARLELSAERRHQFFTELEEPIEWNIMPPVFLLDEPRIADVIAASARWNATRMPRGGTASWRLEGFHKRYRARPLLEDAGDAPFPHFARTSGRSSGAAIGGRAEWGASLLQGSYTWQIAREDVGGASTPTSWDAPHDLNLFFSLSPRRSWTLSTAFTAHSGRAMTPVVARIFVPWEEVEGSLKGRFIRGDRNSSRVPSYRRLDLGIRRKWQARGAEWTGFGQVLNVLNQPNAVDLEYDIFSDLGASGSRPLTSRRGLPVLPTFGLEVRW